MELYLPLTVLAFEVGFCEPYFENLIPCGLTHINTMDDVLFAEK